MRSPAALEIVWGDAVVRPDPAAPFTIGRDADLVVDPDNPFLHRRFLALAFAPDQGLWWLANVGDRLSATVSAADGAMQAWLATGARLPLVFAATRVLFTAGETTYALTLALPDAAYEPVRTPEPSADGSLTLGRLTLTPSQRLLIVALAEPWLRRGDVGAGHVPTSAAAAGRLGWPLTTFNRKLDNVCARLGEAGVRGLHGGPERLARARKARLVEYAVAARLVTASDLELLPDASRA